jgi:alpha-mannosidase
MNPVRADALSSTLHRIATFRRTADRPAALRVFILTAALLVSSIPATAQEDVIVDVTSATDAKGKVVAPAYLNGYRSTIDGATITYHSSHPDVEDALICRARRDAGAISWAGDTIPRSFPGDAYRYIWLAGVERIGWGNPKGERTFHLFVDGVRYFTFTNRKDPAASAWKVRGEGGAELEFRSSFTDKFGDLFGMMTLSLPKKSFKPGRAPVFRVEAEDANAPEWMMVFTYSFSFTPRVRAEPAVLKTAAGGAVPLRVSLDNLVPGRRVRISEGVRTLTDTTLTVGGNIFVVPVAGGETGRRMVFRVDGDTAALEHFTPEPARPLEIWLIPHSHTDIGYTDLQPEVEKKHWKNLDIALDLAERTKDYPVGARFKWNMEVLWPLESYMSNVTSQRRNEVISAVKDGRLGLNGLLVNPLTGLATAPGMDRYLEYARTLSSEYGVEINTAAVSDIPGFTWGIVPALARSGVRYFASAPNNGDRIGHVITAQGDKPFWWESQSGEDRVLFWVAGASYSLFHEGTLSHLGREKLMKLLRKVGASSYPYSMYYLPYTLGDNGGPDTNLPAFVKKWNEEYETPKLVIATHREMFGEFERRYGDDLPVKRGDFTPYWEDGALSTANETARNRENADRLLQAAVLWSMRSPGPWPAKEYSDAWRQVTLWDEHTWGADISVSDPDSAKTTGQWKIKSRYVADGGTGSMDMLVRAMAVDGKANGVRPDRSGVWWEFFNTASWAMTDIVLLDADFSKAGNRVVDESGRELVAQRLKSGELAVLLRDIPPFSRKILTVERGPATSPGSAGLANATAAPGLLSNGRLTVRIDTMTGTITELTAGGRRITVGAPGINRLIYVPGTNPDSALYPSDLTVRMVDEGPLVASYVATGEAPLGGSYKAIVRVTAGIDRVDLSTEFTKVPTRAKEGVHIAFPFEIPDAKFRYDVANAIVEAGKDQLDGSCRNFFSVQSFVDVSNDSVGVTWTTNRTPLVEMGGINAESPWMKVNPASSRFYSYVMNNYWHTNYKADQGGTFSFSYSIHPHGRFDPAEAVKRGRERPARLFSAMGARDDEKTSMEPLLTITPQTVIVESVEPAGDGKSLLLLLYNPSASTAAVSLTGRDDERVPVAPCDPSGNAAGAAVDEITLAPYASRSVLAGKRPK